VRSRSSVARWSLLGAWLLLGSRAYSQPQPDQQTVLDAMSVAEDVPCISRERLAAHVKMWLGAPHVPASLCIRVGAEGPARTVWFEIQRGDSARRRHFDLLPASCDDAHAVLGLAIALAIDAARLTDSYPALTANSSAPRLSMSAQASVAYELLPGTSLGGQIGLTADWTSWLSLHVDVLSHITRDARLLESRGRFDALLVGGALRACAGGWAQPALHLAVCAGLAAGGIHAWGRGLAPSRADSALWLAARSGLRARLDAGIGLLLDLEVFTNLSPYSYEVDASESSRRLTRRSADAALMLSVGAVFGL